MQQGKIFCKASGQRKAFAPPPVCFGFTIATEYRIIEEPSSAADSGMAKPGRCPVTGGKRLPRFSPLAGMIPQKPPYPGVRRSIIGQRRPQGGIAMSIAKLFAQKNVVFSFEIFPPKRDSSIHTIWSTLEELRDLQPPSTLGSALAFFSGVPEPKRASGRPGCSLGTKMRSGPKHILNIKSHRNQSFEYSSG